MKQSLTKLAPASKPNLSAWGVRLAAAAVLAALAIAPSACGSTNSDGQTTTTTAPSGY